MACRGRRAAERQHPVRRGLRDDNPTSTPNHQSSQVDSCGGREQAVGSRVARSHRRHVDAARRHSLVLRRNLRAHSRLIAAVRTVRSSRARNPQLVTPWHNNQAGAGGHILQVDEDNHVLLPTTQSNSCPSILPENDAMPSEVRGCIAHPSMHPPTMLRPLPCATLPPAALPRAVQPDACQPRLRPHIALTTRPLAYHRAGPIDKLRLAVLHGIETYTGGMSSVRKESVWLAP